MEHLFKKKDEITEKTIASRKNDGVYVILCESQWQGTLVERTGMTSTINNFNFHSTLLIVSHLCHVFLTFLFHAHSALVSCLFHLQSYLFSEMVHPLVSTKV